MKNSRGAGLAIISAGYVLAAFVGVAVFNLLPFGTAVNVLIADIAATVLIYIFSLIFNNASFYDPYWSVQPPVILALLATRYGFSAGTALLIIAVGIWAVRLTANWAYTFRCFNTQDWRYDMLRQKSGKLYFLVNLFGIHLFPTGVVYLCILPAIRFVELGGGVSLLSSLGLLLCIFAAMLQLVADVQMHRFRKLQTGTLIRTGLWEHSRHPNYLGEILMWWGVYVAVVAIFPRLWLLGVGALANTLMFVFVSIPMAERRLAATRPDFEAYHRSTRMLLPLPKKAHEQPLDAGI